jgi:glycosyltransferase involved in cell wall biosynthesis
MSPAEAIVSISKNLFLSTNNGVMTLISIVVPVYNEALQLNHTVNHISQVCRTLPYDYEIVLVNDWSQDDSRECIKHLGQDNRIKGINLARNFGKEIALTVWLEYARGQAVITIDADGQYPVDKIPEFVDQRQKGYKIVYQKRPQIQGAWLIKKITSRLFYLFFNTISEFKLESQTTDYRLLDRKVVDIFLKFGEKNRMYRGLIDRIGYKKIALVFDALPDIKWRKPWYNYQKLFNLALHSITSFSVRPLKIVWVLGLILMCVTALMLLYMFVHVVFIGNTMWFTNLGFLTLINTFYVWVMLTSLGMIAIYIANIHQETIKRPLYVVEDELNI